MSRRPIESIEPQVEPSADSAVKPFKHPVPTQRIRRPNPKTGKMPAVKVFGFPLHDEALDAWTTRMGLYQDLDVSNRCTQAMQWIALSTPWCGGDFSLLWAVVKGPPEENLGMLKVFVIGINETAHDLQNAHDAKRVEIARAIIGDPGLNPAWYWCDHDFD